jgi:hypothetical protein
MSHLLCLSDQSSLKILRNWALRIQIYLTGSYSRKLVTA